jgi:hypothetical protein
MLPLLGKHCEAALSDAEFDDLAETLAHSAAARQIYIDHCEIHARLAWDSVRREVAPGDPVLMLEQGAIQPQPGQSQPHATGWSSPGYWRRHSWRFKAFVLAATLLLWAAFFAWVLPWWNAEPQGLPRLAEAAPAELVAQITRTVEAVWPEGANAWETGAQLAAGRRLQLQSGKLELTFADGAVAVFAGPCDFTVTARGAGTLEKGRLTATVKEQAVGFTVMTPVARFRDLGTRFSVLVDEHGASHVHVYEGLVEADVEQSASEFATHQVTAGHSLSVSPQRTVQQRDEADPALLTTLPPPETATERWRRLAGQLKADPALVAYYDFEPGDDASLLYNRAGEEFQGQIEGAAWAEGRWPGKGALRFDGEGDAVRVNLQGEHDAVTLATWVYVEKGGNGGLLMADGWGRDWGDGRRLHWQLEGVRLALHIYGDRGCSSMNTPVATGAWTHLAAVIDGPGKQAMIYADGRTLSRQEQHYSAPTKLSMTSIGNWIPVENSQPRPFVGAMDELLIFGRALTPQEIHTLALAGRLAPSEPDDQEDAASPSDDSASSAMESTHSREQPTRD